MAKNTNNKLELTWVAKGDESILEPRILIENPELSYGSPINENMLIYGDNLLALKALEQDFANKVKCIFIDPPYNTGSAFEHYDDGVEHSLWLSLISQRLKILKNLLSSNGTMWITIDDNEVHYLKVICDEIFGRGNFISNVIWEKADSPRMDAKLFSSRHDHILVYAKNIDNVTLKRLDLEDEKTKHYNKFDENGRRYYLKPLRAMGADGTREARPSLYFPLVAPDGTTVFPKNPDGSDSRWRWNPNKFKQEKDRVEWVKTRNGWSVNSRLYLDNSVGRPPETIWFNSEVGSNRTSKAEIKNLNVNEKSFDTPKPEKLIERIIYLSTDENDLVLDSFLGSGTTAAVAHKMGRRYIGIELGEHAITHCFPRLKAVVDGEQGGISKYIDWKGGGGFKFYTLAPSLLNQDKFGNWVISKEYNAQQLAAAMAKQEGFKYDPDQHIYWKQGKSSEKDFIFTTTQFVTVVLLDKIHDEMAKDESLLITCKSFQKGCTNKYSNITIKKMPQLLLGRCEFGKDDYSFNIINMPIDDSNNLNETDDYNFDYNGNLKKVSKKKDKNSQSELF